MRFSPMATDDYVAFASARRPRVDLGVLRTSADPESVHELVLLAGEVDGETVAAGMSGRFPGMPATRRYVDVTSRHSGRGWGGLMHHELLAGLPDEVEEQVGSVQDDDPAALAVAGHWGYQVSQHSLTVELDLSGAAEPEVPPGVTLLACDDLRFDDEDAVEAMLLASQTNPEFELGLVLTLDRLRSNVATGQRPVAVLARLDGRPAALAYAIADGDHMHVVYTGVDREMRGHGLAMLTKRLLHARAATLGIRTAITDNEEGNLGIRRVNEELGYRHTRGEYWLRRRSARQ
ncbi:GNAT family N-acetyltransferase [Nocardioides sp.]|uniref:GNAT family N-acetyltransferase n=1 Tax=Nocardioides sp. TaxID=35761 RepID=UPI003529AB15